MCVWDASVGQVVCYMCSISLDVAIPPAVI
jgi:hypothetical protein